MDGSMDPWKHGGGWGVKVDNTDPNVEVEVNVGSMDHGSMDPMLLYYIMTMELYMDP